jgi:hypothetical protein
MFQVWYSLFFMVICTHSISVVMLKFDCDWRGVDDPCVFEAFDVDEDAELDDVDENVLLHSVPHLVSDSESSKKKKKRIPIAGELRRRWLEDSGSCPQSRHIGFVLHSSISDLW